jgi:hypothetical protein
VADPLRHLADGLGSLTNPVGSVADKVMVGVFRCGVEKRLERGARGCVGTEGSGRVAAGSSRLRPEAFSGDGVCLEVRAGVQLNGQHGSWCRA